MPERRSARVALDCDSTNESRDSRDTPACTGQSFTSPPGSRTDQSGRLSSFERLTQVFTLVTKVIKLEGKSTITQSQWDDRTSDLQ